MFQTLSSSPVAPAAPVSLELHRETPDIASSTDAYAGRFAGRIGDYFLKVQAETTLRMLYPWRGGRVLDIGGGHSQLAGPLADAGYHVTILGSDPRALERPRRLLGDKVSLLVGDLLHPPVEAGSFDAAISFRILAHLDNWQQLLRAMCQVARHAVVVDFTPPSGFNALAPRLFGLKKYLEGNTREFNMMTTADVQDVLRECGFTEYATFGQYFLPMVLHRKMKLPRVSAATEHVFQRIGLNRRWGSPVILRATR